MGCYYCLLLFWCLFYSTLGNTEKAQKHAEDQDSSRSFGMVRSQAELTGRLDTVSKQMRLRGSNIEAFELSAALSELRDIAESNIDHMQSFKDRLESGNLNELLGLADPSNNLEGFPRAQSGLGSLGNEADPPVRADGSTMDPLQFDDEIKSQIVGAIKSNVPDYAMQASQEVIDQINLVSSSGQRRLRAAQSAPNVGSREYVIPPLGMDGLGRFTQSGRKDRFQIIQDVLMKHMPDEQKEKHQANHQLRILHLQSQHGLCHPQCQPDDASCNAAKLLECMRDLRPYDLAVLLTKGYIVTSPSDDHFGSFSVDETKKNQS